MSVRTPLGPLSGLDLSKPDVRLRILALDKHQLIEGILAERSFLELVGPAVSARDIEVVGLGGVSITSTAPCADGIPPRRHALVWVRRDSRTVREFLRGLARSCQVWPCIYDAESTEFLTTGKPYLDPKEVPDYPAPLGPVLVPLQAALSRVTGREGEFPAVRGSVRVSERIEAAVRQLESTASTDEM